MNRPRVSVIIPNWNGADHLPECLDSLAGQRFQDFETVVVDNASSDTSLSILEASTLPVRVIRNAANLGFSAAVNAGIRATDTELIVLLNNDTRADPGWLEALVAGMDAHPEASFGASRMLLHAPPHAVDSAGDRYSLWLGAGENIGAGDPAEAHDRPAWVVGACAGAAIYRRSLFADIGLFDEEFFLIFEDVDLDLRAQVADHSCLYIPEAIVYHKRGASTDLACIETTARAWRNMIWVAGRSLPGPLLLVWVILFVTRFSLIVGRSTLRRLLRRDARRQSAGGGDESTHSALLPTGPAERPISAALIRAYWRALVAGIAGIPRKRKASRHLRRRGSFALLPILLRPVAWLDDDDKTVRTTSSS